MPDNSLTAGKSLPCTLKPCQPQTQPQSMEHGQGTTLAEMTGGAQHCAFAKFANGWTIARAGLQLDRRTGPRVPSYVLCNYTS